jgi:hypothetical protein
VVGRIRQTFWRVLMKWMDLQDTALFLLLIPLAFDWLNYSAPEHPMHISHSTNHSLTPCTQYHNKRN